MMPTFEFTPGGLDPELEIAFKPLCLELSPEQAGELAGRVRTHLETLRQAAVANQALDMTTAQRIAGRLADLVDGLERLTGEQQLLVVGAARYFIRSRDIQPDFGPGAGFEDDLTVLNFVLGQIGREDLKLEG